MSLPLSVGSPLTGFSGSSVQEGHGMQDFKLSIVPHADIHVCPAALPSNNRLSADSLVSFSVAGDALGKG